MDWPSDEAVLEAWRRLIADPDEAGAFIAVVHGPLTAALARRFPTAHADDIWTAVSDATLAFLKKPAAYDPTQSPLPAFLLLIARRRLANLWDKESRHHRERIPWDSVELGAAARNEEEEAALSFDSPVLQPVLAALSDVERRVLELMRDGERSTAAFAVVLGITDRPPDEQTTEVKRVKDRIMARLRRAAGGGT